MAYAFEDGKWRLKWSAEVVVKSDAFPGRLAAELAREEGMSMRVAAAVVDRRACRARAGVSVLRVEARPAERPRAARGEPAALADLHGYSLGHPVPGSRRLDELWSVSCSCVVDDAPLLAEAAREREMGAFGGAPAGEAALERSAFELFTASSERPSPSDCGFAIVGFPASETTMAQWASAKEAMELAASVGGGASAPSPKRAL